jgi:hypothetical protein
MAKKNFMSSEDDSIVSGAEKVDAMSLRQVDAAIFGGEPAPMAGIPDSGRQTARPLALGIIMPDPTQPRREVPQTIRRRAKEQGLPEWQQWHQVAEYLSGKEIPLNALLRGEGEASEDDKTGVPLVDSFMALVSLAASINRDGLANAITVTSRGAEYVIETGERRYQAFKLLHGALQDDRFAKIPARVESKSDVWRQAAENGSRKPLNAIGMARQMALLIMALNTSKTYAPFDSFSGDCDRAFYAQVADGSANRIPNGASERILQATGLKSKAQIAQYRALLDISDDLWMQADEEDWTENRIRESVRPPSERLTGVNLPPSRTPMTIKKGHGPGTPATGDRVLYRGEEVEYVDASPRADGRGLDVLIFHIENGLRTTTETVHSRELQDIITPNAGRPTGGIDYDRLPQPAYEPPVMPKVSYDVIGAGKAGRVEVGQRRRNTILNRVFEVMSIRGAYGMCFEVNIRTGERLTPSTPFEITLEKLLEMELLDKNAFSAAPAPQFNPEQAAAAIFGEDEIDIELAIMNEEDAIYGNDNPPSAKHSYVSPIDEDAPPEWATPGKRVLYKPSNTVCTVEGASWDVIENCWYVRVGNGEGDWADLLLSDCIPAIEEAAIPTVRHQGLEPQNLTRVISEEQYKLGELWKMAIEFKMQTEASQISRMKVLTPQAISAFLQNDGEEAALARLDAMFEAGREVLNTGFAALTESYNQAAELLRQMAAEKHGA